MTGPSPLPSHPDVAIESDETVWDGRFALQRIKFRQRRFDGRMSGLRTWELWRRGRAAALLPYDPVADVVMLIDQFRLPALAAGIEPVMVEVPAGLCDPDEDPAVTAVREAEEEIGLVPRRLIEIGDFILTPGGSDERVALYLGEITAPAAGADGIVGTAGLDVEHEDIRIRVRPAARAIAEAQAGKLSNVITTVALLLLATRRDELRRSWGAS